MGVEAPVPLNQSHDLTSFDCGNADLSEWLKKKALTNHISGASKTFVVCDNNQVVAYYSLAAGSIEHQFVNAKIKRNQPNPIPIVILGRLAVDKTYQKQGLEFDLVKDAVQRVFSAAEVIGIRAILVHAIDESARTFYEQKCGFTPSGFQDKTLVLLLTDVEQTLTDL
jgi:GNAT superfamily N-acetyltransferase